MKRVDITHLAMRISATELSSAEQFYCNLFGMTVAFRETMTEDGWATLPPEPILGRSALESPVGLVMLYNDAFAIDLEVRPVEKGQGRYSHLGLQIEPYDLERMRGIAPSAGCIVTHSSAKILVFDDPYGMRWELTSYDYRDPESLSAGRREGRWVHPSSSYSKGDESVISGK